MISPAPAGSHAGGRKAAKGWLSTQASAWSTLTKVREPIFRACRSPELRIAYRLERDRPMSFATSFRLAQTGKPAGRPGVMVGADGVVTMASRFKLRGPSWSPLRATQSSRGGIRKRPDAPVDGFNPRIACVTARLGRRSTSPKIGIWRFSSAVTLDPMMATSPSGSGCAGTPDVRRYPTSRMSRRRLPSDPT